MISVCAICGTIYRYRPDQARGVSHGVCSEACARAWEAEEDWISDDHDSAGDTLAMAIARVLADERSGRPPRGIPLDQLIRELGMEGETDAEN